MKTATQTWQGRLNELLTNKPGESYTYSELVELRSKKLQKLYRQVWKELPSEIQDEIDKAIETGGNRVKRKFEVRSHAAIAWLDGDLKSYRRFVDDLKASEKRRAEWEAERQESRRIAEEKKRKRQEEWKDWDKPAVVAERRAKYEQRKKERLEQVARMVAQELAEDGDFAPTRHVLCRVCGKGLYDPVIELRGIGPECWRSVVESGARGQIFGERAFPNGAPSWLKKDIDQYVRREAADRKEREEFVIRPGVKQAIDLEEWGKGKRGMMTILSIDNGITPEFSIWVTEARWVEIEYKIDRGHGRTAFLHSKLPRGKKLWRHLCPTDSRSRAVMVVAGYVKPPFEAKLSCMADDETFEHYIRDTSDRIAENFEVLFDWRDHLTP